MEKILLMVIAIELLAIWGSIHFGGVPNSEPEERYKDQSEKPSEKGNTQFIEPETIDEKFKKSDNIDQFLNQLK